MDPKTLPIWDEGLRELLKKTQIPLKDLELKRLPGDGSDREFYRLIWKAGKSLILVHNPRKDEQGLRENRAYVMIGRHFERIGGILPRIYACSESGGLVLEEDLGDVRLFELVQKGNYVKSYYEEALEKLIFFQKMGLQDFDTSWCAQTTEYDELVMLEYECIYFRNAFLKGFLGLDIEEERLRDCFVRIVSKAKEAPKDSLIHRDFQSRNIMVSDSGIRFVDWQGARIGPGGYDLASLIVDPYVSLKEEQRIEFYEYYRRLCERYRHCLSKDFEETFRYLMLLRNLQILGAFGFLTKVKAKFFFLKYITPALCSLKEQLEGLKDPALDYLKKVTAEADIAQRETAI